MKVPTYALFCKSENVKNYLLQELRFSENCKHIACENLATGLETTLIEGYSSYLRVFDCESGFDLIKGHGCRVRGIFVEEALYVHMIKHNPDIKLDVLECMLDCDVALSSGIQTISNKNNKLSLNLTYHPVYGDIK